MEIKQLKLKDLIPYANNPRKKQAIDKVASSIKEFGWQQPIVVDQDMVIVVGHTRYQAAQKLGLDKVPVQIATGLTDAQIKAYRLLDNRANQDALWDDDMLKIEVQDIDKMDIDLALTGFDEKELDKLLFVEQDGLTDEDAVPEDVEPKVKKGELWQLGNHRLLCGDSTSEADVKKLLNNIYPDLIHTDPPYGMNAVTKSGVLKKNYKTDIMGDNDPEIAKKSFKLIQELYNRSYQIWWGANYYSSVLPDSECWLVWDKNNGQSDQTDCELAYANFRSVVRQFTLSSEKKNRVHPTQKPVSLYNWVFEKFKLSSSTMLDLFGGSGTAIIASEIKKIQSYTMEFDPKFCDVIIKRWEDFTGQTAKLLERGTDTNSLKEEEQWQDQKNIKLTQTKSLN